MDFVVDDSFSEGSEDYIPYEGEEGILPCKNNVRWRAKNLKKSTRRMVMKVDVQQEKDNIIVKMQVKRGEKRNTFKLNMYQWNDLRESANEIKKLVKKQSKEKYVSI